jgi:hypothetical protein
VHILPDADQHGKLRVWLLLAATRAFIDDD